MRFVFSSGIFLIAWLWVLPSTLLSMPVLCQIIYNLKSLPTSDVNIEVQQKVLISNHESFRVYIRRYNESDLELEIYDIQAEARTYTSQKNFDENALLALSLWTRNFMVDARCRARTNDSGMPGQSF